MQVRCRFLFFSNQRPHERYFRDMTDLCMNLVALFEFLVRDLKLIQLFALRCRQKAWIDFFSKKQLGEQENVEYDIWITVKVCIHKWISSVKFKLWKFRKFSHVTIVKVHCCCSLQYEIALIQEEYILQINSYVST